MQLFLLGLILIGVYLLWREYQSRMRRLQEYADKFPGPKPLPILGNALDFGLSNKSFFEFLKRLPKEHGEVSRVWVGPMLAFVLTDPVSTELVLNSNKSLHKSSLYKLGEPVLGQGLLVSDGEIWRRHRKIVAPTFKGKILEQFVDVFNSNTDTLISQLLQHQNGAELDISQIMNLYALDTICESAMGVKVNAMLQCESDYVKAINGMEDLIYTRIFKPWLQSDFIFNLTSYSRQWAKYLPIIHGTVRGIINERKETRAAEQALNVNVQKQEKEPGNEKKGAFLDHLLHYMEEGAQLTDQDLLDEVHNIMAAGHDTTSACLSFTCWLLAKHPQIQEKAVAELRTIFGYSMRPITLEDANEMKYLEQVIKESLRLLPPVPLFGRHAPEDVVTAEYTFPKGSEIGIYVFMLHRHPDYFPDPERFDPDRFLPENCAGRHPYAYIPFGGGPRICLGYKYAFYEMKIAIAQILRHFKLLPASNPFQDLDLIIRIVLKSRNGIPIRLEPRSFASRQ